MLSVRIYLEEVSFLYKAYDCKRGVKISMM